MLKDRLEEELRGALKQKDTVKTSTLRLLKSDMHNYMIEKKLKDIKDEDILIIIQKQVKRRKESIEQFKKGNRNDLAEKEEQELKILKAYMPEPLTEEELKSIIEEQIKELQAAGKKDFGKVMKSVIEKTKGRADGKIISKLVNELLGA